MGGPFIEDRRAERRHGVDAWIRIRDGGRLRALFLQFKVAKLVISRRLNPATSLIYGGDPYFRFNLHKDADDRRQGAADVHRQHNNLVLVRALTGNPAYYCSPAFIEYSSLLKAFYRGEIYENCLLGDPGMIGHVGGRATHQITYAVDVSAWAFHSKPRPLGRPTRLARALWDVDGHEWTADDLNDLASQIERVGADALRDRADEASDTTQSPRDGPGSVLRLAAAAQASFGGAIAFVPEATQPVDDL